MADNLVQRAHWGDLEGMNITGLVRLSFELAGTDRSSGPFLTGRDIKGRDEQAKDCRTYVETRKGNYVYTYEEADTSAYKRKRVRLPDGRTAYRVVRPVFESALEDLKRGRTPDGQRLDGLIVYDIDRLTRDNRHLEDAIEVVQHFNRPILDITGTLDLLTDNGRTVARIVVATNNKQSADTARRVKRKHLAMQQAGIPTGGRRPFGWQADKRTIETGTRTLRFGRQHDIQSITEAANLNQNGTTSKHVAAYLAKYVTKAAEATGTVNHRIKKSDLDNLQVPPHAERMIRTCFELDAQPAYTDLLLGKWAHIAR